MAASVEQRSEIHAFAEVWSEGRPNNQEYWFSPHHTDEGSLRKGLL